MKHFLIPLATAAAIAIPAAASASTVNFTVVDASVEITGQSAFGSTEITETLNPDLIGTSFALDEGDSASFDFFDLALSGGRSIIGLYSISATLEFNPPGGGITSTGVGAFSRTFIGTFIDATRLTWAGGTTQSVSFGSGGTGEYIITLDEGIEVVTGLNNSRTIGFDVELVTAPVPLPAAAWMLLAGIGGLAAVKRRKPSAA